MAPLLAITLRRKLPEGVALMSATLTGPLVRLGSLYLNPTGVVVQPDAGRFTHCVPPGVWAVAAVAPFCDGSPVAGLRGFLDRSTIFLLPEGGLFTRSF